ncbi:MAG: acyl carrier protein [Lachnospiraceae bacterium]|nr:acyl carrier protein [Lachnospiraceae bacterium]
MKDEIKAILEEICPDVDFEAEEALIDDGVIGSFDVIQILSELMEAYDIVIDADEIEPENLNNLDAITALVEKKIEERE